MTVAATTAFTDPLIPNGVTTVFPFDMSVGSEDEIVVLLDGVAEDPGLYTVNLNAGGEGGNVTYAVAPDGDELVVATDPDFQQQIDIANAGPYLASVTEIAYDQAARRAAYLKGRVDLILPDTLLSPDSRAGYFLAWDASGNPMRSTGTGADAGLRTDLAANGGFTLIKHKRSEAGTYARTAAQMEAAGLEAPGLSVMHFIDPAFDEAIRDGTLPSTEDFTSGFTAALAAANIVHVPRGKFVISTISVGAGKSLLAEGHGTLIQQKAATGPDTSIIRITGSHARLGSMRLKGNLNGGADDTTGEQMHAVIVEANNTIGDLVDIMVGDLIGENIRGDLFIAYSRDGRTLTGCKVGQLYGTNMYRCVAAVCTGNGVEIASVNGTQIGYMVLDIEPDGTCAPVVGCGVGQVKGRFAGVVGTDTTRHVDGIRIGTIDLDPAHGGGVGSTPAYTPGASLIDGLQVRNCKSLAIGKLKANGYDGAALKHIYNGGEVAQQPIDIRELEMTDCCKTEATFLTYFLGAAGVTRLTVGHLKVSITRATVSGIRGCYNADIGPIDASLAADTRLVHACNNAEVGPVETSTTTTGIVALSSDGIKVKVGTSLNVDQVFSFSSNTRIEGGVVTYATDLAVGNGTDAQEFPLVIDCTVNGTHLDLSIWQKVILYRDGHTLASAYHHSSGDKVVGARGAAVANPAGGATIDAEARTAIIAILDRLRPTAGHGLIAS